MKRTRIDRPQGPSRRDFLKTASFVAAAAGAAQAGAAAPEAPFLDAPLKRIAVIRGAFLYPPTETLRKAGYYSWPGATFDAEGRHREYRATLAGMERRLGIRIDMDEAPLDAPAGVARFIAGVRATKPDGILLIPFKKSHWTHVKRIVEETAVPSVVLATLGILLVDHINELRNEKGVYLINSLDNLDAVAYGLRMIRTARVMRESRIVNIAGSARRETAVPRLGTQVVTIPGACFIGAVNAIKAKGDSTDLARTYRSGAQQVLQPSDDDIFDAAKAYFALKRIVTSTQADALMMDCLPGLQIPHRHVPPCMGFMSLRDEGIPAGCQSDLSATLTLMLVQQLFDKPGFQQNASMETERNLYFGAHCTCPSRLAGASGPAEPYILMSHAEAGWGCVPRVLWPKGQAVTLAQYLPGETPRMHIYGGTIAGCPDIARTGGCRTNLEMAVDGVEDACTVKGMHQVIFYGNHVKQFRAFCQMFGIAVET